MAQSSHLAWPSPGGRSHVATRNRWLSQVALLLTPALGTAVMMAQINRQLCHLLLINPNQRKGHPNSSEERNMLWAAVKQPITSTKCLAGRTWEGRWTKIKSRSIYYTRNKISIKKKKSACGYWRWFYRIGLMVTKSKLYDSGRPWCRVRLNRLQLKTGRPPCTGGPLMAEAVNAAARRKSDTLES